MVFCTDYLCLFLAFWLHWPPISPPQPFASSKLWLFAVNLPQPYLPYLETLHFHTTIPAGAHHTSLVRQQPNFSLLRLHDVELFLLMTVFPEYYPLSGSSKNIFFSPYWLMVLVDTGKYLPQSFLSCGSQLACFRNALYLPKPIIFLLPMAENYFILH